MYEKKVELLLNKIENIKPNIDYFTKEDILIIKFDKMLKEKLIEKIRENFDQFSWDYINLFNGEITDTFFELEPQKYYESFLNNEIQKTFITFQELEDHREYTTEKFYKETREKIDKAFKDPNSINLEVEISNDLFMQLLEYKRFDILAQEDYSFYDFYSDLSPTLIQKLKEQWPEGMEYPSFIGRYISENDSDYYKISINTLLAKLSKLDPRSTDDYNLEKEKIQDEIIKKIENNFSIRNTSIFLIKKLLKEGKLDNKKIIKHFMDNGSPEIIKFYDLPYEEKLHYVIKSLEKVKNGQLEDSEFVIDRNLDLYNDLLDNDDIVKLLVETGIIFNAKSLPKELVSKFESEIIKYIENKNATFNQEKYNISIPAVISNDVNTALIKFNSVDSIDIHDAEKITEEELNLIEEYLKYNNNIEVNFLWKHETKADLPIVKLLEKYQKIDSLLELSDTEYCKIFSKHDELFNMILSNYSLSSKFIANTQFENLNDYNFLPKLFEDTYLTSLIVNKINHHENLEKYYNENIYKMAKNSLVKLYHVDINKLDRIEGKLGPYIIRYLDNPKILQLFKLKDEELNKLLALFPKEKYSMIDLENAYDSLKQHEFSIKYPSIVNIFPNIMHAIDDKDDEAIEKNIESILKEIDKNDFLDILKQNKIENIDNIIGDFFLRHLITKLKQHENETICIDILHDITDKYIQKHREDYRKLYDMINELQLKYKFDSQTANKEVIKGLLELRNKTFILVNGIRMSIYDYLLKKLNISELLLEETINYFLYHIEPTHNSQTEVNKTIGPINVNVKLLLDNNKINSSVIKRIIEEADRENKLKRIPYIEEKQCNPYELVTGINLEVFVEHVLKDDEVYNSLLKTMTQRKLHLLPNELKPLLTNEYINLSGDYSNLSGFMTFYATIYQKEKERLEGNGKKSDNLMLQINDILVSSEIYSSMSSVYSIILTPEDANLIKLNPGPNSANRISREERLIKAADLTKQLYMRQELTVPPLVSNVKFKSDDGKEKEMHVVVGNFTNPTNLTHGERTGACMRIGGVGESLFNFCLNDKNGFHIRFEEPKTNKYISRVSGFRNGNTVFLNELRYSCDKNIYSDEDVIKSCELIAKELVEASKKSEYPIDNVVIHKAYAMEKSNKENILLGIETPKKGLSPFYSDIGTSAIVLATSNNDKLVPINFDKNKVPIYKTAREEPLEYYEINKLSIEKINRISIIKKMLAGEDYQQYEPLVQDNSIQYVIANDDWYIYIDSNNQIHKEVIDIDNRATLEMNMALSMIENRLINKEGGIYANQNR